MAIELTGMLSRETQGMRTQVVFKLSRAPDRLWLETFEYAAGVQVTGYPREMFEFEGDTVRCSFFGPRMNELLETLHLYIADANKKSLEARKKAATPGGTLKVEQEKRKRTEMLSRELFGDGEKPPA